MGLADTYAVFKLVKKFCNENLMIHVFSVFLRSMYSHLSYFTMLFPDWITKAFVSQMFEGQAVHRCFIVRSPAKWISSCHLLYYPTIQQSRVKSKVESQGWYKKGVIIVMICYFLPLLKDFFFLLLLTKQYLDILIVDLMKKGDI